MFVSHCTSHTLFSVPLCDSIFKLINLTLRIILLRSYSHNECTYYSIISIITVYHLFLLAVPFKHTPLTTAVSSCPHPLPSTRFPYPPVPLSCPVDCIDIQCSRDPWLEGGGGPHQRPLPWGTHCRSGRVCGRVRTHLIYISTLVYGISIMHWDF